MISPNSQALPVCGRPRSQIQAFLPSEHDSSASYNNNDNDNKDNNNNAIHILPDRLYLNLNVVLLILKFLNHILYCVNTFH